MDGMAEDLFAGMSEKEKALKMKEIEWNSKLDAKLREHPEKMPGAVWYIVPNEAGERFTYYGVKPVSYSGAGGRAGRRGGADGADLRILGSWDANFHSCSRTSLEFTSIWVYPLPEQWCVMKRSF